MKLIHTTGANVERDAVIYAEEMRLEAIGVRPLTPEEVRLEEIEQADV